jgi:hypothetical protein
LYARGGLVASYLANGGFPGMPKKGTDTVPAMLTPGEFVVRKDMVNKYGVEFLKAINSGAFQMTRPTTKPAFGKPTIKPAFGKPTTKPISIGKEPNLQMSEELKKLAQMKAMLADIANIPKLPGLSSPVFTKDLQNAIFAIERLGSQPSANSGGSVYNNTYSITVNAKTDANANDIAQTVMAQIKQVDAQRIRGNRF